VPNATVPKLCDRNLRRVERLVRVIEASFGIENR
jgi:hypothetical protein